MGLSHHEGIARRECSLHSRDPFQQLSVLSWHGKHLRWSTAIQLSCQSWWELQHSTSLGFRSGAERLPCSWIFHFPSFFPLHKWISHPCCNTKAILWARAMCIRLKPGNLPWVQVSWQAWSLLIKMVCKPLGKKGFLDSQLLVSQVKGKIKQKKEKEMWTSRRKHYFDEAIWYFFEWKKLSFEKHSCYKSLDFFLSLNRAVLKKN